MHYAPGFNPDAARIAITSHVPFGVTSNQMAKSIIYAWQVGEPVSIHSLHQSGYTLREVFAHHERAVQYANAWADLNPNAYDKRARLASEIPGTPAQYASLRGSTKVVM